MPRKQRAYILDQDCHKCGSSAKNISNHDNTPLCDDHYNEELSRITDKIQYQQYQSKLVYPNMFQYSKRKVM